MATQLHRKKRKCDDISGSNSSVRRWRFPEAKKKIQDNLNKLEDAISDLLRHNTYEREEDSTKEAYGRDCQWSRIMNGIALLEKPDEKDIDLETEISNLEYDLTQTEDKIETLSERKQQIEKELEALYAERPPPSPPANQEGYADWYSAHGKEWGEYMDKHYPISDSD